MSAHSPHPIAAEMLGGSRSDEGRLNAELYDYLTSIDDMVGNAGGELTSRQVIAVAISTWCLLNPGKKPLGDG